jgi:plasmid stabilization system protein ParE
MTLRLAVTRPAKLDLDELIAHIGEDNPAAAVSVATRLLDHIRLLREQPEIGRKGRRAGTRELVVDGTRYIVAYRIDVAQSQVQILRILHTSRRWPRRI